MRIDIKWNVKEFEEDVKFQTNKVQEVMTYTMTKYALKVVADAKKYLKSNPEGVGSDTGHLARSINYKVYKHGKQIIGLVGSNIEYAPFWHEGYKDKNRKFHYAPNNPGMQRWIRRNITDTKKRESMLNAKYVKVSLKELKYISRFIEKYKPNMIQDLKQAFFKG